jgi:uncharacterized protein
LADDGSRVALKIKSVTKFPMDGNAVFSITPSKTGTFPLDFRVPGWSANFTAKVGAETYHGVKDQFLRIKRRWKAGDKVEISLEMPLQVISGGISYPNAIAFKRGPQVLAIDQGLNPSVTSLTGVTYTTAKNSITDEKSALPEDWSWKQAYGIDMKVNGEMKKVVLVPFSEAGQKTANMEVWIGN